MNLKYGNITLPKYINMYVVIKKYNHINQFLYEYDIENTTEIYFRIVKNIRNR